jgi:hypothetical protein
LGLALATGIAAALLLAGLDSFLTLTAAFGPFLFWTFDDLFFRLAMVAIPVRVGASQRIDAESKTARLSRGNPGYQLSTDDLSLTMTACTNLRCNTAGNFGLRRDSTPFAAGAQACASPRHFDYRRDGSATV